jgi:hypothetical protein
MGPLSRGHARVPSDKKKKPSPPFSACSRGNRVRGKRGSPCRHTSLLPEGDAVDGQVRADAGAPCFTCTYDIFPTSDRTGFIEALSNAIAVKDVEFFTYSRELHDSAVGAFTAGFVLGLADRHQDNMLLCGPNRELFAHIDFGYVAGMRPWFDANLLPIPERFKNCLTAAGKWSAFVNDMGFAFAVLQQRRSELCTVAMTLSEQLATVGYPAYIEKTLTSNTIESVRAQVEAAVGDIARRFKNLHHKLQH